MLSEETDTYKALPEGILVALKRLAVAERMDHPYVRNREHFIETLFAYSEYHPELIDFLADRLNPSLEPNEYVRSACARGLEEKIKDGQAPVTNARIEKIRLGTTETKGGLDSPAHTSRTWINAGHWRYPFHG